MINVNRNQPNRPAGNNPEDPIELELRHFCRRFARSAPDPDLLTAYRLANEKVFSQAAGVDYEKQKNILRRALITHRDLEALEYAWRLLCPDNLLTKKVHIFMYLLETSPKYYHQFINDRKQQTKAFVVLGMHALRSAFKLLQGAFSYLALKGGA